MTLHADYAIDITNRMGIKLALKRGLSSAE